jgi:hypothetical protein
MVIRNLVLSIMMTGRPQKEQRLPAPSFLRKVKAGLLTLEER